TGLWGDARTLLISATVLAGSALLGGLVHLTLFAFANRLIRRSSSTLRLLLVKHTRPPARYMLPLIALALALPATPLPARFKEPLEPFLPLCLIGCLGWLLITIIQVTATLLRTRYSIAVEDNLQARRIHTQTEVLERIFIGCVVIITLAAM